MTVEFDLSRLDFTDLPDKGGLDLSDLPDTNESLLQNNLKQASQTDPAQYARTRSLSSETRLPEVTVERNLKQVEADTALKKAQATISASPELTRAYADPGFAKLARDDVGLLAKTVDALKNSGKSLAASVPATNEGLWGVLQAGAEVIGLDAVAQFADTYRKESQRITQEWGPDRTEMGMVEGSVYSGIQSLGQNLLLLPLSLATGTPAPQLISMSAVTGGEAYGTAREKDIGVLQSLAHATSQAAIEYATEKIPVTWFLKDILGDTGFLKTLWRQAISEVPGEQVATLLQDLNDWATLNPDKPFAEYLKERPSAAAQTLISTLVATGGQVTTVSAVQSLSDRLLRGNVKARDAALSAAGLDNLVDLANGTQLKELDPKAFRNFVDSIGAESAVYMEADEARTFFQSNPEADAAVRQNLPEVAKALDDGGPVEISTADYLAYLSPYHDQLREVVRSDVDGKNLGEAKRWMEEGQAQMIEEANQIMAEREQDLAFQESAEQVQNSIEQQIISTGQITPDAAKKYALLHRSLAVVAAKEEGVLPHQVYERYGLRVTGFMPDAQGIGYSQETGQILTETPEFKSWFGESKVVDESGAPLVVYHGGLGISNAEAFDANYGGTTTGNNEIGAFHFTDNKEVADDYGRQSFIRRYQDDPESLVQDGIITQEQLDSWEDEGSVYGEVENLAEERIERQDVYLDIKNPYVIDMEGERVDVQQIESLTQAFVAASRGDFSSIPPDAMEVLLESEYFEQEDIDDYKSEIEEYAIMEYGLESADELEDWHIESAAREVLMEAGIEPSIPDIDGIIIKNMVDDIGEMSNQIADQFIVFRPEQIKSVFNRGTFDPNDPRILYQSVNTRVPSQKAGRQDPHLTTDLYVDLEEARAHETYWGKLSDAVRGYLGLRITKRSPDRIIEQAVDQMASNIEWLYDQVPDEVRERSKRWYEGGRVIAERFASRYGISTEQSSAVIAVTSPQTPWDANVSRAERILDIWNTKQAEPWTDAMSEVASNKVLRTEEGQILLSQIEGKSLNEIENEALQAIWVRVYDEAHNEPKHRIITPEGGFGGWIKRKFYWGDFKQIQKSIAILKDGSIENISRNLGGQHKVRNFYNNIVDPFDDTSVTIDTHAVAAALLRPLGGSAAEVSQALGAAPTSDPLGLRGTYVLYADAYRKAAKNKGILPREMQSIAWEALRRLYPDTFKAGEKKRATINTIWEDHRRGKINAEQARKSILEQRGGSIPDPAWVGHVSGLDAGSPDSTYAEGVLERDWSERAAELGRGIVDSEIGSVSEAGVEVGEYTGEPPRFDPDTVLEQKGPGKAPEIPRGVEPAYAVPRLVTNDRVRGTFGVRTTLVTERTKNLPAGPLDTADAVAAAFSDLSGHAVERLEALVTDQAGNPLAIVGNFKGTLDGASVHPDTVLFEAFRIKGAANLWLIHNHPSGSPELSRADSAIMKKMHNLTRGSKIKTRGIMAIAQGGAQYGWEEPSTTSYIRDIPSGAISEGRDIPVVERVFVEYGRLGPAITDPTLAAQLIPNLAKETPGIVLLDNKHSPVGFVPVSRAEARKLRAGGRLDRLYRSMSMANARAVIIANPNNTYGDFEIGNLNGFISEVGSRLLDVMEYSSDSVGEVRSRAAGQGVPPSQGRFLQGEPSIPRAGYIPEESGGPIIQLFENADLSSLLHESGHFFLDVLVDMAMRNASNRAVNDAKTVMKWFGLDLYDWANMTIEEKRPHHEKFAEALEVYLFEGKAPSLELQSAFQVFRSWLTEVYRRAMQYLRKEKLPDEIRGVMDRMLATEEQIKAQETAQGYAALFESAEQAGMTPSEWQRYQGMAPTVRATQELTERVLRDMKWLSGAKSKALSRIQREANRKRKAVKAEVADEVSREPVYAAMRFLKKGEYEVDGEIRQAEDGYKLRIQSLKETYGEVRVRSKKGAVDPTVDELAVAIAKYGGLSREDASAQGIDPAEFGAQPLFGLPLFPRQGGLTFDAMAERLGQDGYLTEITPNQLLDKLSASLAGEAQYSNRVDYAKVSEPRLEGEPPNWRRLGFGRYGMLAEDGLDPDEVARQFGFDSGDALVQALLDARPMKDVIAERTDQRMLERYGDITDPKSMERAAEEAIHNRVRTRFLHAELDALAKATGKLRMLTRAAKAYAEQAIGRKRVRDIKAHPYAVSEAKAGRAAEKAFKSGDTAQAADHKRAQVLNHHFYIAAQNANEEVEKALRYLKRVSRSKTIEPGYRDQIHALLEPFDLRRRSRAEVERTASLRDWVESQRQLFGSDENGFELAVDEDLVNRASKKHYTEMTLDEMRGMVATIKQIEHLGRLKQRLLTAQDEREFQARMDEIKASIEANARRTVPQRAAPTDIAGRGAKLWRALLAAHRKIASYVREMDGFQDGGLLWDAFVRPMNAAADLETEMHADLSRQLADIFEPIQTELKDGLPLGIYARARVIPGTTIALNREQKLMFALQLGNAGNKQRLMDGGIAGHKSLTEAEIQAVVNSLSKAEWDFVQQVWDLVGSFREQIGAQEKRLTGIEPQWVEATPIQTPYGVKPGGYFPAKYDAEQSTRSAALEAVTDLRQGMLGLFGAASTRSSYAQQRAQQVKGRPLKLSYDVITSHLNEVAHRLAWQDWLIDANRMLKALDEPIRTHYGAEALQEFQAMVRDIAVGDTGASTVFEQVINHLRTGATIVGMGWRLTTAMIQITGVNQSIVRVGSGWVARGMKKYFAHPIETSKWVDSKSKLMRDRSRTMQREISEIVNTIRKGKKVTKLNESYFYMIAKMQRTVDIPTWLGAYEKGIAELGLENAESQEARDAIEAKAVAMADQAVIDSQSGGQMKDLARIQRGSPIQKLFTNFYSYFSATWNLNVEVLHRTRWRKPSSVAKAAADLIVLNIFPAVMAVALREALKGECDWEMECLAKKLGSEQVSYLFGQMVLLREMTTFAQAAMGLEYYPYKGPAGLRFFSDLVEVGRQAGQGEADMQALRAFLQTTGALLHLPTGQLYSTIDGLMAIWNGEVEGAQVPGALIAGAPKE